MSDPIIKVPTNVRPRAAVEADHVSCFFCASWTVPVASTAVIRTSPSKATALINLSVIYFTPLLGAKHPLFACRSSITILT